MKLNSEDLLVILALQQEQTLERASQAMGKDVSSVFRAIKRIELRLGTSLFDRSKAGFHPLPVADKLAEQAREVSRALSIANDLLTKQDMSGHLRITTTDVLLEYFILPNLHLFRERYPKVEIEFDTSNQFAKLWERGFDVAVRPSASPPEQLIGHFLKRLEYRVAYAPDCTPAREIKSSSLKGGDWLVLGGALTRHATRKWFNRHVCDPDSVTTFDAMSLLIKATQAGQGLAVLPALPQVLRGLDLLEGVEIKEHSELWCLYHSSNKHNPLIQGFYRFVKAVM